jgi:hypothetical protein
MIWLQTVIAAIDFVARRPDEAEDYGNDRDAGNLSTESD